MDQSSIPLPTTPSSTVKSGFAHALKCSLAVLLALLSFDGIALRYFNIEKSNDPVLGRVFRAGHTAYSRLEGNGQAHFIHGGIRRAAPLPSGAPPPLLVLGDSFTEALQVHDDEVYSGVLELIVRQEGLSIPVLNFSSSGYSMVDYIDIAPEMLKRTKPAWTIVQVRDNDFTSDAWSPRKRHFVRNPGTGSLTIAGPKDARKAPAPLLDSLYNSIALAPWTFQRLQAFIEGSRNGPPLFQAGRSSGCSTSQAAVPSFDTRLCRQELDRLSRAYGGRLTLLLIAEYDPRFPMQPTPEEAVVEQAAEDLGLSLVITRAAHGDFLKRQASPFGFPNTRFNYGHLNPEGHAAAARLLAGEILRLHRDDLL